MAEKAAKKTSVGPGQQRSVAEVIKNYLVTVEYEFLVTAESEEEAANDPSLNDTSLALSKNIFVSEY